MTKTKSNFMIKKVIFKKNLCRRQFLIFFSSPSNQQILNGAHFFFSKILYKIFKAKKPFHGKYNCRAEIFSISSSQIGFRQLFSLQGIFFWQYAKTASKLFLYVWISFAWAFGPEKHLSISLVCSLHSCELPPTLKTNFSL